MCSPCNCKCFDRAAREKVVIVQNVVIDCRADSGTGRAASGGADKPSDYRAGEPAEDSAEWSSDRTDDRTSRGPRERRGHAARRPCNAADRAAGLAGWIARADER